MFLVIIFVVNNFFLLLHLWSSLQNFSNEKKFLTVSLWDISFGRVKFPIDEQTLLLLWFFEYFLLSEVVSKKNHSRYAYCQLAASSKGQMWSPTLKYVVFGKTVLKITSAFRLLSLSNSIAL